MHVRRRWRSVLLGVVAVLAGALPAQAQGAFTAVGPMNANRALHTATTLADGSVLVVGGQDRRNVFESLSSAETFDPASGTFTLTGNSMQIGRAQHTATLLASGKVLVTGGENQACCTSTGSYGSRPNDTADVYDPVARTFTPTANRMSSVRYDHSATRLADGRVLVTGGIIDLNLVGFGVTSSADLYDPATNSFTPTGNMTVPRLSHASVLLPDGKVLIVGGSQSGSSAELYDPATGAFTAVANPLVHVARTPAAFALGDGTVIIFAGTTVQRYDPATQSFTAMPPSIHDHVFWSARVALADGRILLADNYASEVYDPATGTSVNTGNPLVGDLYPVAAALADGRALLAGGENFVPYTFVAVNAASVFEPNGAPVAVAGPDVQISPGAGCLAPITLNGSGSSDPDGDTLTYTWSLGAATLGTGVTLGVTLAPGTHEITLTVDDGRGGTGSDTVTIVIADTTAPAFVAPAPITLEQTGPAGTPFVAPMPAVTDNCDASPVLTVAGVPVDGVFPAGTTTLVYTATDSAGNETVDATTVTVSDTVAPGLTVPAALSAEAASAAGAVVTFTANATDAVTPTPAVTCTPASGTTFALGATAVTCAARDTAGNVAAASFVVTVRDTTAPTLVLPAVIAAVATDPAGAVVDYAVSATDLVTASPTVTCLPPSGSAFAVGTHTVACVATDAAGNAATGTFTVSVTDEPTAGFMHGGGRVMSGADRYDFNFSVLELADGSARGRLKLQVCEPVPSRGRGRDVNDASTYGSRGENDEDDDDRNNHDFDRHGDEQRCVNGKDRFVASSVAFSRFTNNPAIVPGVGRFQRGLVDTVVFAGTGQWNGRPGYRFEVRSTDQGEPGRARDTFAVTIVAADGTVVAMASAPLAAGNVQSTTGFNILTMLRDRD